jgi:hypothetical protein
MLGKFLASNTVYCASAGKVGIPTNPDPATYRLLWHIGPQVPKRLISQLRKYQQHSITEPEIFFIRMRPP